MDQRSCSSSTPKAGELPYSCELKGNVVFRTGLREKGPRKGVARRFQFAPSEGYAVVKAKIMNMLKDKEFGTEPKLSEGGSFFLKPSTNARQIDFKPVSSTNFWQLLKARWACLTTADVTALIATGGAPETAFEFEFLAYLIPPPKPNATLRRATVQRIAAAAESVVAMQEARGIQISPIAAHHISVHHARQTEGTPLEIPDDNATRQAQALDATMDAMARPISEDSDVAEIEVQFFGAWVKIPVRILSLQSALRLPQHDIFTRGIFHGFTPQIAEPRGEDMPDVDHVDADMPFEP